MEIRLIEFNDNTYQIECRDGDDTLTVNLAHRTAHAEIEATEGFNAKMGDLQLLTRALSAVGRFYKAGKIAFGGEEEDTAPENPEVPVEAVTSPADVVPMVDEPVCETPEEDLSPLGVATEEAVTIL